MTVNGQLFDHDGRHPLAGVVVFAYHSDRNGLYNWTGVTGWRLQGWVRTDETGLFQFDTIRPAPYPGRSIPAHIHIYADGPTVPRQEMGEIHFADDPLLSAEDR